MDVLRIYVKDTRTFHNLNRFTKSKKSSSWHHKFQLWTWKLAIGKVDHWQVHFSLDVHQFECERWTVMACLRRFSSLLLPSWGSLLQLALEMSMTASGQLRTAQNSILLHWNVKRVMVTLLRPIQITSTRFWMETRVHSSAPMHESLRSPVFLQVLPQCLWRHEPRSARV